MWIEDKKVERLYCSKETDKFNYTNDLTREMDNYIYDKSRYGYTYMELDRISGIFNIKFPGGTRGIVKTNNDSIITEIKLYENIYQNPVFLYDTKVKSIFEKYIDRKLVFI